MDQKRALLVGASGGIGAALAVELGRAGYDVTGLSRGVDGLDVTDEASISAHLGALGGPFELVFVATGALEIDGHRPEKSLPALNAEAMLSQFALNAVGPALVLKHALALMPRDRRCVFAALSARVGSIGDNRLGGWYSYRAAKAALNQLVHTGAIEASRSHKQSICVTLHPGTVDTGLSQKYGHPSVTPAQAAQNLVQVLERLGPADTGKFFDWSGAGVEW